jgi:protein SCO1/2
MHAVKPRYGSTLKQGMMTAGLILMVGAAISAAADDRDAAGMDHGKMDHGKMGDGMAPAMAPPAGKPVVKERQVTINLPPVKLVREDGKSVQLPQELDDGRPVLVNFIYTTCFGICPISSQTFAQFQSKLAGEAGKVHLVSVSIDPEEDTPPVLREYAKKYHAGAGWNHYTGTVEASIATQRAFEVYKGDKMNHDPVTLMRVAPGKPWVRIDGFATADDLMRAYRRLLAAG